MASARTTKIELFVQDIPEALVIAHTDHLGLRVSFAISPKQADVVVTNTEGAKNLAAEIRARTIIVANDHPTEGESAIASENGCTVCAPTTLAHAIARILHSNNTLLPGHRQGLDGG